MRQFKPESRIRRFWCLNVFDRLQAINQGVFLYLALICAVLISLRFWFSTFPANDFWKNVQVEAVGFLFDIIFLGLGFYLFTLWYQRKQDIKRWQEEIDDFRGWNEPEAMYRIVGNIKRLNRVGVTTIDLGGCYLKGAILSDCNLKGSDFSEADLREANFRDANLDKVHFGLTDLRGALFYPTSFLEASFAGVNLDGVRVDGHWWFSDLKEMKVRQAEELERLYEIVYENAFCMLKRRPRQ